MPSGPSSGWWCRCSHPAACVVVLAVLVASTVAPVSAAASSAPAAVGVAANSTTTDGGAADVVADAMDFRSRDHTVEQWLTVRNHSAGTVERGIQYRVRAEHSADRVRIASWLAADRANGTVTPAQEPTLEVYRTPLWSWRTTAEADKWRLLRVPGAYTPRTYYGLGDPEVLRNASMTVLAENESTLVVRTTDADVLAAFDLPENGSVRFVVDRTGEPTMSEIRLRYRLPSRPANVTHTVTYRVSDVGSTTAPPPDSAAREPVTLAALWEALS